MMELITIDNSGNAVLDAFVASQLEGFERQLKMLKQKEDELKDALHDEMMRKGVIKINTDGMTISFIDETDKEHFDQSAFRKDHAELYDDYIEMKRVKSYVKVRLKA